MIPPAREIASSLRAAWRLLFLDAGAMAGFNLSLAGFWRSFFAAVLALPYYVVMLWQPHAEGLIGLDAAVAAYLLGWLLFPLVAAVLSHILRLGSNYFAYIIAFNWAGALVLQPFLLLALLHQGGVIDEGIYNTMSMVLFFVTLWYGWAIARIGLGAGIVTACGFVILSTLLEVLVNALLLMPGQAS